MAAKNLSVKSYLSNKMLIKTQAILLKKIKYGDSSLIFKMYSREKGMQSFMMKAGRKNKKLHYLQSLSAVNLLAFYKEKSNFLHIKEIENAFPSTDFCDNIYKINLAIFINEIILKSIAEEEANPILFDFLWNEIADLQSTNANIADFHLRFLFHFSKHLGFFPEEQKEIGHRFFDLREGVFCQRMPEHNEFLKESECSLWNQCILRTKAAQSLNMQGSYKQRILEVLIEYYSIHLHWETGLKSHEVIKEIFA